MKDRLIRYSFICLILVVSILQFSLASEANQELSNEILAWGFRRGENHEPAVLEAESLKVVEKFNGMAIGNPEKKNIYLTFDAGYEAGYTEEILEILKQNDITAAFFVTAHYVNTATDLVKQMIQNGNVVGNHTVNHACLPGLSDDEIKEEIMKLHNSVYEVTGYEMTYFRPPRGEFSERTASLVENLGYTSVLWSNAYDDWDQSKQGRSDYGKKKVLDNLHNGAIILLHSTSQDNVTMLDSLIKEAKEMGYEFKSLEEFEK